MADVEALNRKLTYVLWSVLLAGSMYLMIAMAAHKTIIIADAGYEQGSIKERTEAEGRGGRLLLQEQPADRGAFYVPLMKGGKAENVVVENSYAEEELRIYIKDAEPDFYEDQAVSGDISPVLSASWEAQGSGVLLRLKMSGVYEYKNSMEDDRLRIEAGDPREAYKMIVVVDPAGGGGDAGPAAGGHSEKEIALAVSKLVQEQINNTDIKLYFTRTEDVDVPVEKRCALVWAVNADIFVNIGVSADEDSGRYGICGQYNEEYFIPGFGNVQLADSLTRNVTVAGKNRAVGLRSADEDSILRQLGLPAARVEVGFLSNEQERSLLASEEYQKKLAEGIAKAIEEVYREHYE